MDVDLPDLFFLPGAWVGPVGATSARVAKGFVPFPINRFLHCFVLLPQGPIYADSGLMVRCVVGWGWWVMPVINTFPDITIGHTRDTEAAAKVCACWFLSARARAFAFQSRFDR